MILIGGFWVLRPLRMGPMVGAFAAVFVPVIAFLGLQGDCFQAIWRASPICGSNFWIGIAASPEVAIFVLLMMSDPRTAPDNARGRAIFAAATALLAALLIYTQPSEWGIKLALLASLVVVCSFVPLIRLFTEPHPADAPPSARACGRRRGCSG